MNTPSQPTTYSDLIKKAAAYLQEKKQAVSNERGEGTGTPATDIEDKTKKPAPGDALKPQPDAAPSKQNLPSSGGVDSSKKQPENSTASGALEGNRGNSPTPGNKEPAVSTDDVMSVNKRGEGSKVAANDIAKMANDILYTLSKIGAEDDKKESPSDEKKEEKKEKKDSAMEEKKESPSDEKKEEKKEATDRPAELSELSRDLYAKIAMVVLETDEGRNLVEKTMKKKAGEEAARAVLMFNDEVTKEAAAYDKAAAEFQQGSDACDQMVQMLQQAPAQTKYAATHQLPDPIAFHTPMIEKFATDQEKVAYGAGAETMAAMDDNGGQAPEMESGGDEEGGDQTVTMEDIAAAISMLVQEGAITPEIAQQVLAQIMGGGAGEEGAPEGAEMPSGEEKMSSAIQAAGVALAAQMAGK